MNESLVLQVIERARAAAAKDGLKVCISVVDASGLMSGFCVWMTLCLGLSMCP